MCHGENKPTKGQKTAQGNQWYMGKDQFIDTILEQYKLDV